MKTNIKDAKDALDDIIYQCLEKSLNLYDRMHAKFPKSTNYAMQAIGIIGGDFIAKASQGQRYTWRDFSFTAFVSLPQSLYYPKIIDLSNRINNNPRIKRFYGMLHINDNWARGMTITAVFFPINMLYWNYLSVKNHAPINMSKNLEGAKNIAEASMPYLYIDYKVGQMPRRYALPVWSAAEFGWNGFIAFRNYLTRNI